MSSTIPTWHHITISVEDGLAEAVLHDGQGGAMVWNAGTHREITELFAWLAVARCAKVMVLTGSGDEFCTRIDSTEFRDLPWRAIWSEGQRMLTQYLDSEVVVVAAVNGPAYIHAELMMMGDIVIGCPEVEFADHSHFTRNIVPGDGAHAVWSALLGPTRSSYYHLTGASLKAKDALLFGVLHEIHPRQALLDRARELARELAKRPGPVLAYTRSALRMHERRHFAESISHGMAVQGMAMYATGMRVADEHS